MKTFTTSAVALLLLLAAPVGAQRAGLSYPLTLVELHPAVADRLARQFDTQRERLWCVTAYSTREQRDGYALVRVTDVRDADVVGRRHSVGQDIASECIAPDGTAQPTIHSHPSGTCQASPDDAEAILSRGAPFDGILCGDRYVVWYFSEQLLAVALRARVVADNRRPD